MTDLLFMEQGYHHQSYAFLKKKQVELNPTGHSKQSLQDKYEKNSEI